MVSVSARGRPFVMLAKPTGAACHLDCAYCFLLEPGHLLGNLSVRAGQADGALPCMPRLFRAVGVSRWVSEGPGRRGR